MMLKAKKRLISFLTAVVVVISSVAPAFAASAIMNDSASVIVPQSTPSVFRDTSSHWGQAAIEKWNGYGVVKGYNGEFRPNDPVTRAEFSVMIDGIVKYIVQGNNNFSDLNRDQWYYNAIVKLNTAGVLKGTEGKAMPQSNITRQEAALLIAETFQIDSREQSPIFGDSTQVSGWAKGAVGGLVSKGVISGMPDGTFRPKGNLTRAEAVTLFDKLIQSLISRPGEYSKDIYGNVVINTSDVVLKNMKIAGDLYITQGVGEGEVTLENVEIAGTVHVQGGGVNSIIFNNVDVRGALVVNKYNGQVRILATGSTSVAVTVLESGAMLVTRELTGGGFETVEISADILAGQEVKLDGNFNTVVNRAPGTEIIVNGTIKELVAEVSTVITGNATISTVTGADAASVSVNGEFIASQGTTGSTSIGGSTGGSSGGSSGGGSAGGGSSSIAVTGVSIVPDSLTLSIGETKQLEAKISPTNATNKKVNWQVADDSLAFINVTADGLITAVQPGRGTVIATTQDGGFTGRAVVEVKDPGLGVSLTSYTGAVVSPEVQLDQAVQLNNANVNIADTRKSLVQERHYDTAITAISPLQQTSVTHSVYTVVSLVDYSGNPVETSTMEVTLNGSPYNASFGEGLADGFKEGSFVLKLDIDRPEKIQQYQLVFTREGYEETSLTITFRPVGTVSLQGIGAIIGQPVIGTQLTAGDLNYDGVPANRNVVYQWYQADSEHGVYTAIAGANNSAYELTAENGNKYIRVGVKADEIEVSGMALSPAFGPVESPISVDDVFAAIEAEYLGSNSSATSIISNMVLPTSLPAYPGVSITWSSSDEQVITNTGIVTRHEQEDLFVTLTATLNGKASGVRSYELIVRSAGTENVEIEGFIDPYFVDGYPQAYVKNGTIHVRYALNKPAEVYMVVNVINGRRESDVKAVLEGHAGINQIIHVDSWPYFQLSESEVNQIQDFDTGERITSYNSREARVEFVIVDEKNNYTSSNVTTILFDQAVVGALDTQPPHVRRTYINNALDTIYIYYNEKLDPDVVPSAGDFVLSAGQVEGVSLYNYTSDYGEAPSYVKLMVSGIVEADKDVLTVSYSGSALQDLSDAENKAPTYTNEKVTTIQEQFGKVMISSDRQSMIVEINPGWNSQDNLNLEFRDSEEARSRFVVDIDGKGRFKPSLIGGYLYSIEHFTYNLKFDVPLPVGEAVMQFNTSGITNWAKDAYPDQLMADKVEQISLPGLPSATYSITEKRIILNFANGFQLGHESMAAGLVLKVDGVEYKLRGFIVWPRSQYVNGEMNSLEISLYDSYGTKIKNAIESGTDIQIKYTKVNGTDNRQLSDAGGALLSDFDYVQVIKLP